jgi:hypothetical protein
MGVGGWILGDGSIAEREVKIHEWIQCTGVAGGFGHGGPGYPLISRG